MRVEVDEALKSSQPDPIMGLPTENPMIKGLLGFMRDGRSPLNHAVDGVWWVYVINDLHVCIVMYVSFALGKPIPLSPMLQIDSKYQKTQFCLPQHLRRLTRLKFVLCASKLVVLRCTIKSGQSTQCHREACDWLGTRRHHKTLCHCGTQSYAPCPVPETNKSCSGCDRVFEVSGWNLDRLVIIMYVPILEHHDHVSPTQTHQSGYQNMQATTQRPDVKW